STWLSGSRLPSLRGRLALGATTHAALHRAARQLVHAAILAQDDGADVAPLVPFDGAAARAEFVQPGVRQIGRHPSPDGQISQSHAPRTAFLVGGGSPP